ncbi:MAG TPA: FecR domain-containing protein [Myxococcota bacterium]|nr:FecR domain-containing protein [Myxococcota bacterium]HRY94100.1 FecR domain-containing protein [Myxococcota bacterium]
MRERILFIVAVGALLLLVPLVYYLLFERSLSVTDPGQGPAPPPPVAPQAVDAGELAPPLAAPVVLSVLELRGQVEVNREGGAWTAAEEGLILSSQDRVRTGPESSALLSMPGIFAVRLDSESEFKIRSLAEDTMRFLLEQGMLSAEVREDPDLLFEVAAATATVRTHGADFRMHVSRAGVVAVGASAGQVELESSGKVVQVRAGYLTRAERDRPPLDPIPIPAALFLKVRWPARSELGKREVAISGATEPGARVLVDGAIVEVDSSGRFRKVVGLKEGANRVLVRSQDVGGNQVDSQSPPLHVDTRPDSFEIKTSPDMWKKDKQGKGDKGGG